ncbi:LytR/AlgR family response regulator transcription factor [Thiocystis violascens]|uniref:Response regulator of the LytR/AlgR family n=1 Tax=Thiocystis violascens (strain ATCC 17096 / DSM 198 / 6111) TaxID=765911 RepID=I3YB04_THIV6|nr:LytTR family DNA-binding domain-containing protein [Thiocystis violascens]AFL74172.1 response regulator of the LytR/AlgR family [Thiocystis violascens DSM 198]
MRILVVDDDSSARDQLRHLLAEFDGDHALAGEAADGWEAISCCRSQPIDLVLLDARMPGMSGTEVVRRLAQLDAPPAVILMAADEPSTSAVTGSQGAACLPKPVQRERLEEELARISRQLNQSAVPVVGVESPVAPYPGRRRQISARYRGQVCTAPVRDILFLRADQKYVAIRHPGGELLVDESLRTFEQEFGDLFVRIHRNALVARARLVGLEKTGQGHFQARLSDCDERLPVSRRHVAKVRRWLRERTLEPSE